MIDDIALKICEEQIPDKLKRIKRCAIGYGNYVYIAECREKKYVLRCSEETNAYESTIHWLHVLEPLDIPAPGVIAQGKYEQYNYLILTYMKGQDIGVVYPQLTDTDKRRIAKDIVRIQNEVSGIDIKGIEKGWNWSTYVSDILHRAKERIEYNGYLFYTLMYCVDFMGERGMRFMDKTIEVNGEIVNRLNRIYDDLIQKWYAE